LSVFDLIVVQYMLFQLSWVSDSFCWRSRFCKLPFETASVQQPCNLHV